MGIYNYDEILSFSVCFEDGQFKIRYRIKNGKMKRLPPSEHPRFSDREEAREWLKKKESLLTTLKAERKRIQTQNSEYPKVTQKVEEFIKYKKEQGVKEHKTIHSYFNNYILDFYLNKLTNVTIESWPIQHKDFIKHLLGSETKFKRALSEETTRKICFYLNEFYRFLFKEGFIQSQINQIDVPKAKEDNLKDLQDSFWTDEEFNLALQKASPDLKDLILFLVGTGMRINEALGASYLDLKIGKISHLDEQLQKVEIKYPSYIVLKGQLDSINSDTNEYSIKPFKSSRVIHPRDFRYIPLSNEVHNMLLKRAQSNKVQKGLSSNHSSFLIFKDLNQVKLLKELNSICSNLNIKPRGFHSFRHTFTTKMLIKTALNSNLVRIFTGHKSQKVMERYNHFIELLNSDSKQEFSFLDFISL